MFVTIDPGISTGWALWNVSGLVACGLGDPRTCRRHVTTSEYAADVVDDVWIEYPVIYPRSKARPADILKLAQTAAEFGGIYRTLGVAVHYVEPAKWKGQVPKKIHHPRVLSALQGFERAIVAEGCKNLPASLKHNVLDAVGLGQWVRSRGGK